MVSCIPWQGKKGFHLMVLLISGLSLGSLLNIGNCSKNLKYVQGKTFFWGGTLIFLISLCPALRAPHNNRLCLHGLLI